jgi:hypothetical protein
MLLMCNNDLCCLLCQKLVLEQVLNFSGLLRLSTSR